MTLMVGNSAVSALRLGSTAVTRAYFGSTLVYGAVEPPAPPPPALPRYTYTRAATMDFLSPSGHGPVFRHSGSCGALAYLLPTCRMGQTAIAIRRSDRTHNPAADVTIPRKDWRGGTADSANLYLCNNDNGGEIWRIPLDGGDATAIVTNAGLVNPNGVCLAGSTLYIANHQTGAAQAYSLAGARLSASDVTLSTGLWDLASDGHNLWSPSTAGIAAFTLAGVSEPSRSLGTGQYYGAEAVGNRFYGQKDTAGGAVHVWTGVAE